MAVSVYLADLRYNYSGHVNIDAMPLGIAFMKAVMDRDFPEARSRLFAYPDRLWEALRNDPPDVLMLSNYVWNESLSGQFAKLAKRVRPETLVVMGGPNISIENERKLDFVRSQPDVDLYLLGEADFLATEVVRQFADAGKSIRKLREREIPSSIYRRPDGELVLQPMWNRHKEVDDIPSAFLTGIQDEFFDGKLAPMLETNRGCPFSCTFCVQGTSWYTKVHYFGTDRLYEELDYIGGRIKKLSPTMGTLVIADPNYGMFERDAEISSQIAKIQAKHGWPTFISASTGKNRPDRIIKSLELVNKAMSFRQALQSTNKDTLVQIKRSNIDQQAYADVMSHVQGRGMRSVSDLILGLPGETLASHLEAIRSLIDARTNELHNFQAMLLKGTELEMLEARKKYGFVSRFRVLPKEFGVYGGDKVFDMDEIVVTTDTLSFDDYIQARKYGFAFSVFWNNSWFEDAVTFAEKFGITRSQSLDAMLETLEADRGKAHTLLQDFVNETKNELFPTREECIAFYTKEENFAKLSEGEVGDNLMYKYRSIASFFLWPEISRVAMEGVRKLLLAKGAAAEIEHFDQFWSDFQRYIELKHAHGTSAEQILSSVTAELRYDLSGWLAAGMPKDIQPYRLATARTFEFRLPEMVAHELEAALRVWTTSIKGLTKGVTRIRAEWQARECHMLDLRTEPTLAVSVH